MLNTINRSICRIGVEWTCPAAFFVPLRHLMTPAQHSKSRLSIHLAALAGAVAAFLMAQLPASDNTILVPIEVLLVIRLGSIFHVGLRHSVPRSFVFGSVATFVGRGISEFMVGWVPGFGNAIDALTAAAVIEFLGHILAKEFDRQQAPS
jgi:uncharacterized protein (DUF697 family)